MDNASGLPTSTGNVSDNPRQQSKVVSGKTNRIWRTFWTLVCWGQFGLGAAILNIIFPCIYILPISPNTKKKWVRLIISKSCLFYLNSMRFFRLLSYSIKPKDTMQTEGKIIIANHPSLLDAFFILGMCPNLCCITKEALWKNPFTALIVRMADYIHNGSDDFIEQANRRLKQGENILIFPEGTRNRYDDQLDFKRGAANLALLTDSEVVPILILCRPRAMQKGEPFYNIPATPPHFHLETLATINPQKHIDVSTPKTLQYRHFTRYLKAFYKPLLSTKQQDTDV